MRRLLPGSALALGAGLAIGAVLVHVVARHAGLASGLSFPAPGILLYRRLEKGEIFALEQRRRVYAHVAREPGITATGLAEAMGFDRKTASHHARVLEEFELLEAERDGRRVRYFLPGDRAHRVPAGGVAADLLRLALREPGVSQADAALALSVSRSTVQWHARRLTEKGFLERGSLRIPTAERAFLERALLPPAGDAAA